MALRNLELTDDFDSVELFRDEATHTCVWFKLGAVVIVDYYLPSSLDLALCTFPLFYQGIALQVRGLDPVGKGAR